MGWKAIRWQSKGDALYRLRQCIAWAISKHWLPLVNALPFWRRDTGFSEQIYCKCRCRYTASAVEVYLKRATQYYCYGNWDLFYSRKSRQSRQSRQKLRAIFREIREREIITLVFSSDAARRRPYPLTTHYSKLIAQKPLPIPVFTDGGCVRNAWIPRVQEPAAIRPFGHRVLQTPLLYI